MAMTTSFVVIQSARELMGDGKNATLPWGEMTAVWQSGRLVGCPGGGWAWWLLVVLVVWWWCWPAGRGADDLDGRRRLVALGWLGD